MLRIFLRKSGVYIKKSKSKENICVVFQHIGYRKHPSIKNKLIIDEKVSDVIRKIFDMYANENGSREIVQFLNRNKYLSPLGYRKTGIIRDKGKTDFNWNEVTICNMLKNEVYIGNTVQNKKSVVSYKVKKIKTVEKENQIRVNNTHEAIIDKDTFEKVQCILQKRGTNTKLKYNYLLRGLLYCYHCKRKLQIVLKKSSKKSAKIYPYITCSNYKERSCYPLNINYEKFEKNIINIIRKICQIYSNKKGLYSAYKKYQNKNLSFKEGYKTKIKEINKSIFEINNNLDKMYMDKLGGVIIESDYIRLSNKLILERENLNKQKQQFEKEINRAQTNCDIDVKSNSGNNIDKLIEGFLKLEEIDKIYLYRLINKIEIDKDKNVYIYFNFSNLDSINKESEEFIKIEDFVNEQI